MELPTPGIEQLQRLGMIADADRLRAKGGVLSIKVQGGAQGTPGKGPPEPVGELEPDGTVGLGKPDIDEALRIGGLERIRQMLPQVNRQGLASRTNPEPALRSAQNFIDDVGAPDIGATA